MCPHSGGQWGRRHRAQLGHALPGAFGGGVASLPAARTAALHPKAGARGRVGHLRGSGGLTSRAPMRREGARRGPAKKSDLHR